jgi:uncharacterized protein (UPF0548 family)
MFSLRKPTPELLRRCLTTQAQLEFSYPEVGATAAAPPPEHYVIDRTRAKLGDGEVVFEAARTAIKRWQQFAVGWLEAWPPDTPLRAGETVIIVAHVLGLWSLNAARIVYVVDESNQESSRFGFAYGTLPGHVAAGEERFLIEWDLANDGVWYDILAFSRPRHVLARIGKRHARRMQRRFGQDSVAAMLRAASHDGAVARSGAGPRGGG